MGSALTSFAASSNKLPSLVFEICYDQVGVILGIAFGGGRRVGVQQF